MAGTPLWDYVFIRVCIFSLHMIAPLSTAYSLASLLAPVPFQPSRVLEVWLALETIFYFAVFHIRKAYLQRAAKHPLLPSRDDRRKLFWRCHTNIPDPEMYLKKWFRNASVKEIKRENVKDFFRWAFLNTAEVDETYDEELEEYTFQMEKLLGRRLEPGRGNARCLRLTLDKVEMLHRSLTWYLCIFLVDTVATVRLYYHSFHFHRSSLVRFLHIFPLRPFTLFTNYTSPGKTLTYWYRPHNSKTRLPILFIHGIGVGLYPYINFLTDLNADDQNSDGQVGIIAIEIMSISSRITAEALLKEEMCNEVRLMLNANGWEKVALVSHSYGSVIAAHLFRDREMAERIGPALFVDPVSFLLHLPDVAYNFICREPSHANEHLLSYFGSKDMGTAHTLFRRFFWADNILWKNDFRGHHITVALSGKDRIVNTKAVGAYLTGSNDWVLGIEGWKHELWRGNEVDLMWFQDLDHGQAFSHKMARGQLVQVVKNYCNETS